MWNSEGPNGMSLHSPSQNLHDILDTDKRRKLYEDMQEICRNDSGTVVPMFNQMVEASSAKLAHGPISGHMALDGMRNGERWWFK